MRAQLHRRLQRLEARYPPYLREPLPDVAPEWQELARRDPVALEHAVALTRRLAELTPEQDFLDDDEAVGHWLWLGCTKAGSLAEWMQPYLEEIDRESRGTA